MALSRTRQKKNRFKANSAEKKSAGSSIGTFFKNHQFGIVKTIVLLTLASPFVWIIVYSSQVFGPDEENAKHPNKVCYSQLRPNGSLLTEYCPKDLFIVSQRVLYNCLSEPYFCEGEKTNYQLVYNKENTNVFTRIRFFRSGKNRQETSWKMTHSHGGIATSNPLYKMFGATGGRPETNRYTLVNDWRALNARNHKYIGEPYNIKGGEVYTTDNYPVNRIKPVLIMDAHKEIRGHSYTTSYIIYTKQ